MTERKLIYKRVGGRAGMSKEHFPVFLERLKTIVGRERYDQVVQQKAADVVCNLFSIN